METDINVRCKAEDVELVRSLTSEAAEAYVDFIKKETGKVLQNVKLTVIDTVPLLKNETE